ncbi:MAG: hypothetical protein IPG66_05975 [Hydrogenophilales bacterium]|nr:hypothetical protein [Hydrogenophilales bacterium]
MAGYPTRPDARDDVAVVQAILETPPIKPTTVGSCRLHAIFQENNVVNPAEYLNYFDELPYVVAVATETMGLSPPKIDQGAMSPSDLMDRAESAISKYPVHAYETGLVALLMLADWLIADTAGRRLLREQFQRIGAVIQDVENAGGHSRLS